MKQLNFEVEHRYDDDEGIPILVKLPYAGSNLEVTAKVDTGSAVCLFSHEDGLDLGISIEQVIPIKLGGLAGSLEAFGQEVTLKSIAEGSGRAYTAGVNESFPALFRTTG
jgi:hypothetical protein